LNEFPDAILMSGSRIACISEYFKKDVWDALINAENTAESS